MAKLPIEKFTSSKGKLSWMFITDEGKDNYNGDGKIFSGTVSFTGDVLKRELERIKAFWSANIPEGITDPTSLGFSIGGIDKDELEDLTVDEVIERAIKEDMIHLVMTTGTTYPNGKAKVIETFNAKSSKVQMNDMKIGNGSVGCLLGSISIWERGKKGTKGHEAGVTFYLDGVQIVNFVEYSAVAEMESYEDEEGAFTGSEPAGLASQETTAEEKTEPAKGKPRL